VVSGGLACIVGALVLGAAIPALRHARLANPDGQARGESGTDQSGTDTDLTESPAPAL
jgi:hypothetical protein